MSMSSATPGPPKRTIRLHEKTRSGCATCKKRHVKCDETKPKCHNCLRLVIDCVWKKKKNLRQARLALYKPLTAPPPVQTGVTSLRIIHHFSISTSAAFCSDSAYSATTAVAVPQLAWGNPHLLHAVLAIAALHLSRLYSDSDMTDWSGLASAHRRAAVAALPNATDPDAKFVTILSFTAYSISSSLKSSPENIFQLINSLHNVWSALEGQRGHQNEDVNDLSPFALNVGSDSVAERLVHLQQIYDPSDEAEPDEPFEFEVREAYRAAVEALCVAYPHSLTGFEGKSVLLWPALFGKKFCELLNQRRQRALVLLYCYLVMLRDASGRCWWLSEAGRCAEYVYGLLNTRWKDWLRDVYWARGHAPHRRQLESCQRDGSIAASNGVTRYSESER